MQLTLKMVNNVAQSLRAHADSTVDQKNCVSKVCLLTAPRLNLENGKLYSQILIPHRHQVTELGQSDKSKTLCKLQSHW